MDEMLFESGEYASAGARNGHGDLGHKPS